MQSNDKKAEGVRSKNHMIDQEGQSVRQVTKRYVQSRQSVIYGWEFGG